MVVAAGQPRRHVAGRQSVVLRELILSQRVVATKFLEGFEKKNKTICDQQEEGGGDTMQKYLGTQKSLSELMLC